MKKQNPGKIFLSLLLLSINLIAGSVSAKVDKTAIYRGDNVNLTVTAQGEDVTFPAIQKIGSFDVTGTASAQNTTIINGKITQTKSKSYTFAPTQSVKIPALSLEVDGKTLKTDPLEVKVLKPTQAASGAPFILEMHVDKTTVHVGEEVRLDVKLKQKLNAKADKIEITPPKMENFWVKQIQGTQNSVEGDYRVQTYSYLLFPQKAGHYTIPAIAGAVGTRVRQRSGFGGDFFDDPFFQSMVSRLKWQKLFSNETNIDVKPLPDNLEVYGDFKINAQVDKTEVSANKPVNLTIRIHGEGNVDDIKKFDIDIPDAIVYADEPKITSGLHNGKYIGEFTQKIAIIADKDYTIPQISFTYFDAKTQKKVTKDTQPIAIKVKGSAIRTQTAPKIEKSELLKDETNTEKSAPETKTIVKKIEVQSETKYIYLLAGFILGSGLMFAWFTYKDKLLKEEQPIIKRIRKAKTDKVMYDLLLPYSKEGEYIAKILRKLEENIYQGKSHQIDRDEIADYFEEVVL